MVFMPFERFLKEFSITFDSVLCYFMEKELDGRLTSHMDIDTIVIQVVTHIICIHNQVRVLVPFSDYLKRFCYFSSNLYCSSQGVL